MIEKTTTIVNEMGLHARPAAMLVKLAAEFKADVLVCNGSLEVNGKSIMGVLTLAAECGSQLTVKAAGVDAEQAVESLVDLVDRGFGEKLA